MKMRGAAFFGLLLPNLNGKFTAPVDQLQQLIVYLVYSVTKVLNFGQKAIPPLLGFSTIHWDFEWERLMISHHSLKMQGKFL
jgi:hypothetical protein